MDRESESEAGFRRENQKKKRSKQPILLFHLLKTHDYHVFDVFNLLN